MNIGNLPVFEAAAPGLSLAAFGDIERIVADTANVALYFAIEELSLIYVNGAFRRITGHGLGEPPDPNDSALGEPGRHTAANTIIVHGDKDETTILADSLAWGAVRDVPVLVVPGADHFFHRKLHVIRDVVGRLARPLP